MGKSRDEWNGGTQDSQETGVRGVTESTIGPAEFHRTQERKGMGYRKGIRMPRGGAAHAWPRDNGTARSSSRLGRGTTGIGKDLADQLMAALKAWG